MNLFYWATNSFDAITVINHTSLCQQLQAHGIIDYPFDKNTGKKIKYDYGEIIGDEVEYRK